MRTYKQMGNFCSLGYDNFPSVIEWTMCHQDDLNEFFKASLLCGQWYCWVNSLPLLQYILKRRCRFYCLARQSQNADCRAFFKYEPTDIYVNVMIGWWSRLVAAVKTRSAQARAVSVDTHRMSLVCRYTKLQNYFCSFFVSIYQALLRLHWFQIWLR